MRYSLKLPGQDSNLDEQDQNLLCYRYTTGYCERCYDCFVILRESDCTRNESATVSNRRAGGLDPRRRQEGHTTWIRGRDG